MIAAPAAELAAHPLAVDLQGPPLGLPILCLHGHPGRGQSMRVFTTHLRDRYRIIAPDLRGYGRSHTRSPFQMADHLDDLEALLNRLQVEQCVILGWSLGGILAMELALRWPHRVKGLILVATAARPRGSHPPITVPDNIYTAIAGGLNWLRPGWRWNIDTWGRRSLFRYLIQQHTPATYRYLANDAISAYLQTSTYAHQALSQALRSRYDRLEAIRTLTMPSLCLWGEQDRHITAAASLETAQALPQCEFHAYPHTAHLFPWEIPAQVLNDIDQWLANQGLTAVITDDRDNGKCGFDGGQ